MKKEQFQFTLKDITEGGVLVAIAIVLNFIKIPVFANGGSINMQVLPLFLYSLRKGWFKGFIISGLVFGIVTCLIDASGNIANFPFDYLIGFGSCSLVGLFNVPIKQSRHNWSRVTLTLIATLIATLGRMIGACLSSMIIYEFGFKESLIYNLTYIPLSALISFILLSVILCIKKDLI